MAYPVRMMPIILSKGSILALDIPADVGNPWPVTNSVSMNFLNSAGDQLLGVTGSATADRIRFLVQPAPLNAIPAGAKYEAFITTPDGPVMVRYGVVIRKEAW